MDKRLDSTHFEGTYHKRYPWLRRGFVGKEEEKKKGSRALKGPCEGRELGGSRGQKTTGT